ncbi:hypothetical protein BZ163_18860 [Pseudomonas sp. VI4.1]|nr:hypothetical protein BZ163_18860 [Pseudomonas sp. VI4.1]
MLAKNLNAPRASGFNALSLATFASKLAPTGGHVCPRQGDGSACSQFNHAALAVHGDVQQTRVTVQSQAIMAIQL